MTGRHVAATGSEPLPVQAWYAVRTWLQGRHGVWATVAVCLATAASLAIVAFSHGNPYKVMVYAAEVCKPDPSSKMSAGLNGEAYVGCPAKTSSVPLLVSASELVLVLGVVAAVVLLSAGLHSWEQFAKRGLAVWYAVSAGIAVALPVVVFVLVASALLKHVDAGAAAVIGVNVLFDAAFVLFAMVLFGRFWGLWLGLVLLFVNVKTQTWQLKLGFSLRMYESKAVLGLPNPTLTIWIAVALIVLAVLLWSLRRGTALLIRED